MSSPKLLQDNDEEVTEFSWTFEEEDSCWSKFHNFYADKKIFGKKKSLNNNMLGFAGIKYTLKLIRRNMMLLVLKYVLQKVHTMQVFLTK